MERKLISTGSPFEQAGGYSRAVADGDWCFVAGTTGYDYGAMAMPDDAAEQARNAIRTIAATLDKAGFSLRDVVRAYYYVAERRFAEAIFPVLGEAFAEIRPAATLVVCELLRPEMKVEIEVTALRRQPRDA
jgi:enamine deaminase RidA (YjgF/YER057c/UK114 family)